VRAFILPILIGACATEEPTFSEDVQPIFARACATCHDGSGFAPGSFTSYRDAADRAETIRFMVRARLMPPFGVDNSGACNTYQHPRWLSEEEIDLIDRWAERTLEGPPRTIEPGVRPDIETTAAAQMSAEYTPSTEKTDDFRCFVIDPEVAEDGYVTGYRVDPGEPRVVHHVLLFTIDTEEARAQANELDAKDEAPGYACFGGSLLPLTATRLIAGFAPGTGATLYPEGTGIPIDAGTKLVLQIHYNTAYGALPDRTSVALEVRPEVERPAVIAAAADLGLMLEPGRQSIASGPIQIRIPGVGAFVHGVFPHMHQRGRALSASIVHPDDSRECLTRVDRWDFDFQEFYFFDTALYAGSNDRFELGCEFDTTSDTETVRFGEETADEMCLLGLYVTLN
jgi:hypothetical protein